LRVGVKIVEHHLGHRRSRFKLDDDARVSSDSSRTVLMPETIFSFTSRNSVDEERPVDVVRNLLDDDDARDSFLRRFKLRLAANLDAAAACIEIWPIPATPWMTQPVGNRAL